MDAAHNSSMRFVRRSDVQFVGSKHQAVREGDIRTRLGDNRFAAAL
jgi:hypothetical protein